MPKVYDITKVKLYINDQEVTDIGPDGFGITPSPENTLITGLAGEIGFNIDPSTAATATVSLRSTSPFVQKLITYYTDKQIVSIRIAATDNDAAKTIGFTEMKLEYAMVSKPPEWKTSEKEAPQVVFNFIGYGLKWTFPPP